MATHTATIEWTRAEAAFTDNRYSRAHTWRFDGGAVVPASASPHVVRVPLSDPSAVDPEEAYVASLASCHMLWFLNLAALDGWRVDRYDDTAQGHMVRRDDGREWVAEVMLRPQVRFGGEKRPDDAAVSDLHHRAHESCYLANSVKTVVRVEGTATWGNEP